MAKRRTGNNSLAYLGVEASTPNNFIAVDRAPTGNDYINYNIGDEWLDTSTEDVYKLVDKSANVATWSMITGSSANLDFVTDSGTATSSGGAVNVLGGDLISTTGSGDTVTASLDNGTDGQLIIASTAGSPAYAALASSDSSITITNGSNSIDLVTAVTGVPWTVATGATQAIAVNTAYFANYNGTLAFTLPAAADVGDRIEICQMYAGQGWSLAQNAGQTCYIGNTNTTTGVGGSLASTADGDWIEIVCRATNTDFQVSVKSGNITVV